MEYSCDFETINKEEDCRVWAWAALSLDEKEYYTGTNIDSFMQLMLSLDNPTLYFHNLKFDGTFILYWLFENGYVYDIECNPHTFTTLISDMGQYYCVDIIKSVSGRKRKKVHILDSLKIIPLPVADIPKAFGFNIQKLEIDYNAERGRDYVLTELEKEYLKHDVLIVAKALNYFKVRGLDGMTIGSIALREYKKHIPDNENWDSLFPMTKENDAIMRSSYKGAFTYLKSGEAEKTQGAGLVFDVNSLYPSVMRYRPMPYGAPIHFFGEYKEDALYNWYIILFEASFHVREGMLPTIQLKNHSSFIETEYVTSTNGEIVELCMTRTDFELFQEHYNIDYIEFSDGYKFKTRNDLFTSYVDKWINVKNKATIDNNQGMRTIAKLLLNNLYGKFASRPEGRSKIPYYEDGKVRFRLSDLEERNIMYIPIGSAITAYAREVTIRAAQANYDRFIYADTDSLHLKGIEMPDNIDIDPVKLGAWKHESTFTKARFLRAKSYIEEIDGNIKVTCAGLPKGAAEQVNFDNFYIGAAYGGKLAHKLVKGGTILYETTFEIKRGKTCK